MSRIFHSIRDAAEGIHGPTVVTVGNFDGVHLGHRSILDAVKRRAKALGASSVVVTFQPHPSAFFRPERPPRLICSLEKRVDLLLAEGVDSVIVMPFTAETAAMSPRAFVQYVLADSLHAVEVHEGQGFLFGHRTEGNMQVMAELGREMNFSVVAHAPRMYLGEPISSTRIRNLISEGKVHEGRHLLGRPFSMEAPQATGRGVGTKLLVPTINLAPTLGLTVGNGVYVTCVKAAGRLFQAVTNAGVRPTFGELSYAVESHLLNFEPVPLAPDTQFEVSFLMRLRGEMHFPSPEELRMQISKDIARAQRYFRLACLPVTGLDLAHGL